jgi:hypothetical protein
VELKKKVEVEVENDERDGGNSREEEKESEEEQGYLKASIATSLRQRASRPYQSERRERRLRGQTSGGEGGGRLHRRLFLIFADNR